MAELDLKEQMARLLKAVQEQTAKIDRLGGDVATLDKKVGALHERRPANRHEGHGQLGRNLVVATPPRTGCVSTTPRGAPPTPARRPAVVFELDKRTPTKCSMLGSAAYAFDAKAATTCLPLRRECTAIPAPSEDSPFAVLSPLGDTKLEVPVHTRCSTKCSDMKLHTFTPRGTRNIQHTGQALRPAPWPSFINDTGDFQLRSPRLSFQPISNANCSSSTIISIQQSKHDDLRDATLSTMDYVILHMDQSGEPLVANNLSWPRGWLLSEYHKVSLYWRIWNPGWMFYCVIIVGSSDISWDLHQIILSTLKNSASTTQAELAKGYKYSVFSLRLPISGTAIECHSSILSISGESVLHLHGVTAPTPTRPLPWPSFACSHVCTLLQPEEIRSLVKIASAGIPRQHPVGFIPGGELVLGNPVRPLSIASWKHLQYELLQPWTSSLQTNVRDEALWEEKILDFRVALMELRPWLPWGCFSLEANFSVPHVATRVLCVTFAVLSTQCSVFACSDTNTVLFAIPQFGVGAEAFYWQLGQFLIDKHSMTDCNGRDTLVKILLLPSKPPDGLAELFLMFYFLQLTVITREWMIAWSFSNIVLQCGNLFCAPEVVMQFGCLQIPLPITRMLHYCHWLSPFSFLLIGNRSGVQCLKIFKLVRVEQIIALLQRRLTRVTELVVWVIASTCNHNETSPDAFDLMKQLPKATSHHTSNKDQQWYATILNCSLVTSTLAIRSRSGLLVSCVEEATMHEKSISLELQFVASGYFLQYGPEAAALLLLNTGCSADIILGVTFCIILNMASTSPNLQVIQSYGPLVNYPCVIAPSLGCWRLCNYPRRYARYFSVHATFDKEGRTVSRKTGVHALHLCMPCDFIPSLSVGCTLQDGPDFIAPGRIFEMEIAWLFDIEHSDSGLIFMQTSSLATNLFCTLVWSKRTGWFYHSAITTCLETWSSQFMELLKGTPQDNGLCELSLSLLSVLLPIQNVQLSWILACGHFSVFVTGIADKLKLKEGGLLRHRRTAVATTSTTCPTSTKSVPTKTTTSINSMSSMAATVKATTATLAMPWDPGRNSSASPRGQTRPQRRENELRGCARASMLKNLKGQCNGPCSRRASTR